AAFVEEVPMVVMSGDVPTTSTSRAALHDTSPGGIDGMSLMRTVTRYCARIESPEAAPGIIEHALRMAMGSRPGPVFLSLPLNVTSATEHPLRIARSAPPPPAAPDARAVDEVAVALRGARRPLLVVGNGARSAAAEVAVLAERLACPVVT